MDLAWGGQYGHQRDGNAGYFKFFGNSVSGESSYLVGGLMSEPSAYFGHPIQLSFDVREEENVNTRHIFSYLVNVFIESSTIWVLPCSAI